MKKFDTFKVESCINPDSMSWPFVYKFIWYFKNQADAILAWKWKAWYWWDADVKQEQIIIFETFEEFKNNEMREKREKALEKLSEEEKKLLWVW